MFTILNKNYNKTLRKGVDSMNLKKRIAVFLCILLTLPSLLQSVPGLTLEANAADSSKFFNTDLPYNTYSTAGVPYPKEATAKLSLEIGQEIDMSSYCRYIVSGNTYSSTNFTEIKKETYKSSNKAVAAVSKNGVITAKKKGDAVVTLTYKKLKLSVHLQVIDKQYTDNQKLTAYNKKISNLWKKYGTKKITSKNAVPIYNQLLAIYKEEREVANSVEGLNTSSINGYYTHIPDGTTYGTYHVFTHYCYLTLLEGKLHNYLNNKKNSILATISTKNLTAKSIKATSKKIEVKFNKKITSAQLLSAGFDFNFPDTTSPITSKGRKIAYRIYKGAGVNAYNYEYTGTKVANGSITIKPGAKSATIKLNKALKKGSYYIIFCYEDAYGYGYPALSISKGFKVK